LRVVVEIRGATDAAAREGLAQIEGVTGVDFASDRYTLTAARDVREDVFKLAVARGWTLVELRADAMTLEDIFARLTTQEAGEKAAA
jgi:hypothetical protein